MLLVFVSSGPAPLQTLILHISLGGKLQAHASVLEALDSVIRRSNLPEMAGLLTVGLHASSRLGVIRERLQGEGEGERDGDRENVRQTDSAKSFSHFIIWGGGGAGRVFEKIIWRCFWPKKIIWPSLYVEKFFLL